MIFATMKDGERVGARGGVYMRPIVRLGVSTAGEETTFVRSHRWTRYVELCDGRTRVTGRGSAFNPPRQEFLDVWAERFPQAARLLRKFEGT